jgi:YegS/Rv2252/BmrU family lipid kinase
VSRAAVVYNPTKVTDLDALKKRVEPVMAAEGWEPPLWLETSADDPGIGMCQQAIDEGCDVVFVAGGDGTVMAAATAMASSGVPMAILPTGTGNLLARNLDLPLNDEEKCLRIGLGGRDRAIDVAGVADRKFVVMAGLGFDAAIMRDAPEGLKKAVGWPAYVVSAAKHLRGRGLRVTITLDDGTPLQRRVRTVVVGNVGKLQGNIPLLPEAQPDDGVLDVVLISIRNVIDWIRVTGRVMRRADVPDRRLERFTAKHVVVEASHTQPRQLDGDVIEPGKVMDIRIEPGALIVRVG